MKVAPALPWWSSRDTRRDHRAGARVGGHRRYNRRVRFAQENGGRLSRTMSLSPGNASEFLCFAIEADVPLFRLQRERRRLQVSYKETWHRLDTGGKNRR